MDIQFINITSYIRISSNAEHFYARVGKPDYTQENYLTMLSCDVCSGVVFPSEGELRFFPNREQAEDLWEKDYGFDKSQTDTLKEDIIAELQEDGTIRFPSVIEIIQVSRKKFPNSILCFSMNGTRKEFARFVYAMDKKEPGFADKITALID